VLVLSTNYPATTYSEQATTAASNRLSTNKNASKLRGQYRMHAECL
jgi:hypothetical protein